jgi:transcriptional regulator with XRE-family HTH domain
VLYRSTENVEMTPAQCRAARALLDLTQPDLAEAAGLGLSTVVDFERTRRNVSPDAIAAMKRALELAGVEFTNGNAPTVKLGGGLPDNPNALAAAATEVDVKRALELFEGFLTTDRHGLPEQRFLKGDDETAGREALARLLRSHEPLDKQLRLLLAGHFDGRSYSHGASRGPAASIPQELRPKRRLEFASRRGNISEDQRTFKIGAEILRLLDENPRLKVDKAKEEVAIKYKLSEDSVKKAWEALNKRGWKRKRPQRPLKLPPVK